MSDLLDAVRKDENFRAVMIEAKSRRPVVPEFRICKTKDEQDMVVESIKYSTAMRQGWDLLYTQLTGNKPQE